MARILAFEKERAASRPVGSRERALDLGDCGQEACPEGVQRSRALWGLPPPPPPTPPPPPAPPRRAPPNQSETQLPRAAHTTKHPPPRRALWGLPPPTPPTLSSSLVPYGRTQITVSEAHFLSRFTNGKTPQPPPPPNGRC